jgi:tetratricopeptide (TPR) repeat protein
MDELKTLSQRELEALREKYEYTLRMFPDSDSLLALAEVHLALGEVTKARRTVSDFTETKGDSSRARLVLARAHLMCWNAAAAEEELKKALSLDHRNTQASDLLIHIYKSAGRTAEAFKAALSPVPDPWRREKDAGEPEEPSPEPEEKSRPQAGVFETDTMLNLYVSQGLYEDALGIVEVLCEMEPDNAVYRSKCEEIRALLGK